MYRVNVISMIIMLVVYFIVLGMAIVIFYPMMLKHIEEAKTNTNYAFERGFLLLFGGKCDWLSWMHLASPIVLLLGYVLMYAFMVKDAKEVRADIKAAKKAKKEEKTLKLEEERKIKRAQQEEKHAALLAKQEEERKLREEENKRRAEEKEAFIAKKKAEKEAKEQELAARKAAEEEAKAKAIALKEEESREKEITAPMAVPMVKEKASEEMKENKEETKAKLKTVYLSFLSVTLPVLLLQLLSIPAIMERRDAQAYGYMASGYVYVSDSEFWVLSLGAAAIYLIFNLIFIIMAAANPRKASLSLRTLVFSSLGVQVFLSGLGLLEYSKWVKNWIYFLTLPLTLLLLVATIVLLCIYKKKSRIKTYICFGSLALLMTLEFVFNFFPQYTFWSIRSPSGAISVVVAVVWSAAGFALVFFSKKLSEGYLLSEGLPKKVKPEREKEQYKIKEGGKSSFDGKLIQLIGYHILGYLITGITFGLGYPWAKCFVEKWTVKHQTIDDERLSFDGNGAQLFGKYILWIVLTVITFGIYGLWLAIKMKKWTVSHTHIKENGENNKSKSTFDGKLIQLIGYSILAFIVTVFSIGLAYPWAVCLKLHWEAKHTVIDGKRLCFNGNGAQLFGKYILWIVLTVVTFGIYGLWLAIKMKKWTVSHTHFQIVSAKEGEKQEETKPALEDKQN